MHPSKPVRGAVLILVGVVLAAGTAGAQPRGEVHWSLEARIAAADGVVRGTIVSVSRKVLVPPDRISPDGVWSGGKVEFTLIVKVDEVLKGNFKEILDDLAPHETFFSVSEFGQRYEDWRKARTPFLWFVGPAQKRDKDATPMRTWEALPLDPLGKPASGGIGYVKLGPPLFSLDLSVLKDAGEILPVARAFAKNFAGASQTHGMDIPKVVARRSGSSGTWNSLVVPVAAPLQTTARRLIAAPGDFMPKNDKLDPAVRYQVRFAGVGALRYFKSDENIALLRTLLDDPPEVFQDTYVRQYPICRKACEMLIDWGVPFATPKSAPETRALDLGGSSVTDAGLKQLAGFANLASLNLRSTKITDAGLKHLTGLTNLAALNLTETHVTAQGLRALAGHKKLATLTLANNELTDTTLRVLRDLGLLHTLCQTQGKDEQPKSAAEVTWLDLSDSQVTDAGLKELAGLANLDALFLSRTRVTDAGLKELARFQKLTTLYLFDTPLTEAGLKELAALTQLKQLALSGPRVTDAGLKHLAALTRLTELKLHYTKVTPAARAQFHKALPKCEISP